MTTTPRFSRKAKILIGISLGAAASLLGTMIAALILLMPSHLKPGIERRLSERLGLDVAIESLSVSFVPQLRVTGTNVTARVRGRPSLPPFVAIDHFWVELGPFSVLRGHVSSVHLGGLKVSVPPEFKQPAAGPQPDGVGKVIVDRLDSEDATLTILTTDPKKAPLVFAIQSLAIRSVGFDRAMPFTARLVNPIPVGEVTTDGTIGPWVPGDPSALPLAGQYKFKKADLATIRGIGGTLTSEGTYQGKLVEIRVEGRTDMPDFNLDLGGRPVPLSTVFKAVVNGSDGTTRLDSVTAKLLSTNLQVSGIVENLPGPGRHSIDLTVQGRGRIEDLLRLLVDAPKPAVTGAVTLTGHVALPPGATPVRDRLVVKGRFALARALFSDMGVQAKVDELSRRGQGHPEPTDDEVDAATNLQGHFELASGLLSLPDLTFVVPGATVALEGHYALATTEINFTGELRMDATLSKAVGGVKSLFLRPFDWLVRRNGAGTIIPIAVSGTKDAPKVGVRMGRILSRKSGP